VSVDGLRQAAMNPSHQLDYRLFDAYDGLAGIALQQKPLPSAARSRDGLLWFATNEGIAVVDPQHIERNVIAPNVIIHGIVANKQAYSPTGPLQLPNRTSSLEIDYTATSLTIPERVRFRFRLEGVDANWQEAGSRREAFYTNLEPGHYRFRVIAANNDGVWNEEGASLEFTILPTFFQTRWFALLCMAVVLLTLYSGYVLRMHQIAARTCACLVERHLERERIARELHDTLLQGFQGLILRMHSLVTLLSDKEPRKSQMTQAIDQAEALLVEERDSVRGLRAPALRNHDLAAALMAVGQELAPPPVPTMQVSTSGRFRPLQSLVLDEIYRIGREAIVNAHRYGAPRRIEVTLSYGTRLFQLSIRDDGRGMDLQEAATSVTSGRCGMRGMRERAQRIGAQLEIHSPSQGGLEVTVILSAKTAYPAGRSRLGDPADH
jgi:signal transduction histidine kinase